MLDDIRFTADIPREWDVQLSQVMNISFTPHVGTFLGLLGTYVFNKVRTSLSYSYLHNVMCTSNISKSTSVYSKNYYFFRKQNLVLYNKFLNNTCKN